MGLTGELVKSVFSRGRSGAHDGSNVGGVSMSLYSQSSVLHAETILPRAELKMILQGRKSAAERRRWSSVRSYLCGEEMEFDSVIAEEDSASVKSSEATVTQPVTGDLDAEEGSKNDATETGEEVLHLQQTKNSVLKRFDEEDAAVIIQSAFRRYLARRLHIARKLTSEGEDEPSKGIGSPSKADSIGTSIEVQTGNSMEVLSVHDERLPVVCNRTQHKARIAQVLKPKEDWDDSTVSSNTSRMRIQHKLEAMTRRERALAYAFSQQLRVCSRKRQVKTSEGTETDMGWSWLERWMATRESSIVAGHGSQKFMVRKRLIDLAGEEKESCGSNEVSVHLDSVWMTAAKDRDNSTLNTDVIKSTRNIPKSGSMPHSQRQKVHEQVSKKHTAKEMRIGTNIEQKQKPMEGKNEND